MRSKLLALCLTLAALAHAGCRQQHSPVARTVYRVGIVYKLIGHSITDGSASQFLLPLAGSAVAVSPDGDLLSARHVVDAAENYQELCFGTYIDSDRHIGMYHVKIVAAYLTVEGPDGQQWQGTAMGPIFGPRCDGAGRPHLIWNTNSMATIVAADGEVDLALVHVVASGLAHLKLDRTALAQGTAVVAIGKIGMLGTTTQIAGTVTSPCIMKGHLFPPQAPMPMLVMSQLLKSGMSGGPTVSGDRLLGINVSIDQLPPYRSYAIAGTYAAAWYDWVRGVTPQPPPVTCS